MPTETKPLSTTLTPHEFEVIHELAKGKSYEQIVTTLKVGIGNIRKTAYLAYSRLELCNKGGNPSVIAAALFRRQYPDTPLWYEEQNVEPTDT